MKHLESSSLTVLLGPIICDATEIQSYTANSVAISLNIGEKDSINYRFQ